MPTIEPTNCPKCGTPGSVTSVDQLFTCRNRDCGAVTLAHKVRTHTRGELQYPAEGASFTSRDFKVGPGVARLGPFSLK